MRINATQKIEIELDKSEMLKVVQEYLVKTRRWEHNMYINSNNEVIREVDMDHLGTRNEVVRLASGEDIAFYTLYRGF